MLLLPLPLTSVPERLRRPSSLLVQLQNRILPPPPPPPPPPFGKSSQGSRSGNHTPIVEVVTDDQSVVDVSPATPVDHFFSASAPPPPPPAPSDGPQDIPRVDYLLQNGGIPKLVTKHFSMAQKPPDVQIYQQYPPPQPVPSYVSTFSHYEKLLENYQNVIQKNGSLAVATGYKSVARRLLDRLEDVFSRNISSELCSCVMCREERDSSRSFQRDTSVSWGEVLELVSGRRELPAWPPFVPPTSSTANTNPDGIVRPMQKLDIDISEEWRDHFIRQSKKTKQTVDKWLACQPEEQAAPPTEVDDDTLSFTMATYLDTEQDRRTFFALVRGSQDIRAPTPAPTDPKPDLMPKTATALQRLYYLPTRPRDPECAMFLLNNPSLHTALATLAAISAQEWDLLISGPIRRPPRLRRGKPIPILRCDPLSRTNTPSQRTIPRPNTIPQHPLSRAHHPRPKRHAFAQHTGPRPNGRRNRNRSPRRDRARDPARCGAAR